MQTANASNLESLVRVAQDHGIDLTVDALRSAYVPTADAMPTSTLIAVAQEAGLDAKCIHPKWRDLPRLANVLPAIIRLKDGGAAVLVNVMINPQVGQVVMLENPEAPEEGEVALDEAHLAELWTGEVILIKRRHLLTDQEQPFGYRWLAGQILREKSLFRDIAVASIISTVLAMAPAIVIMIVVDRVLINHSVSTLEVLVGGLFLIVMFEMALNYVRRMFTEVTATRIDGRLNLYMMRKLLGLPMDYFERNPVGETMSKLGSLYRVRTFLTGQLFQTIIDVFMLIVLLPILFWLSWRLSAFVLVMAAAIVVIITIFLGPMNRAFQKVARAEVTKNTYLVESVYGIRTIKSLALEGRRLKEWDARVAQALQARHEFGVLASYPQALTLPFEKAMYAGSILLGAAMMLIYPDISPGGLMAFGMLASRVSAPLVQMARLLQDGGEIRGAISDAGSVLNHPPEPGRVGTGMRLPVFGNISFQSVDFRYAPSSPLALNGVSFDIRAGTIFGIMGRSGSGKTTITRLLQGLNPKYEGIIKIDGMDLREMDLRHLRTSIGIVAQENFLFTGTIRENIGMARPNSTFAEIVRAAQLAGAEEFIERMPRGYDTFLEEGGSNLSGGQRQRLAIARALVLDPAVMILDEATSALDAESEAIINANLMRIAQSRTIICVSHRLAMLVPADAILVMEKGKVYDIGTHHELLNRCDIYKHMWFTQNRHSQPGALNAPIAIAHSASA